MEIVGVLASSHLDSHGERIAPEALERFAEILNGGLALPLTLGHDPTIPPLGKILEARIDQTADGETRVIGKIEIFPEPQRMTLPDGTVLLETGSASDKRAFRRGLSSESGRIEIQYDINNFASQDDLDSFLQQFPRENFLPRRLVRKAAVPDPAIIIAFTGKVVAYLATWKLFQKTVERLSERVADDAVRVYDAITRGVLQFVKNAIPRNRPRLLLFVVPGDPLVEFAIKAPADRILESVDTEKWMDLISEARKLRVLLGATQVQYLFDTSKAEWALNYLLTGDGKVIGSPWSFRKRAEHVELLHEGGLSMSGAFGPDA